MELIYTNVFKRTRDVFEDPTKRFILLQGGSRSSKTYSLCQLMLIYCLTTPNKTVSIIRKTLPSLRATVMRDFFEIMNGFGIYEKSRHNKTENTYTFSNGTMLEFFSVDDEQKVRGRKRDVCWINEANQVWEEDFTQLNLRTESKLIFDYNPSDLSGYLYPLAERPNAVLLKSTYLDNPFLSQSQIDELEYLKHTDPDMYLIYAKGERAQTNEHVFRHWTLSQRPPHLNEIAYGLDFGWNHPTALVRIYHDGTGKEFHLEQVVHQSHLTNDELGQIMLEKVGHEHPVACDAARPDAIFQLQELGLNCSKADKAVKKGFESMKSAKLTIEPTSLELIRDFENYRYKKHAGKTMDEVLKLYDDGCDAARYGCLYAKTMGGSMSFGTLDW